DGAGVEVRAPDGAEAVRDVPRRSLDPDPGADPELARVHLHDAAAVEVLDPERPAARDHAARRVADGESSDDPVGRGVDPGQRPRSIVRDVEVSAVDGAPARLEPRVSIRFT